MRRVSVFLLMFIVSPSIAQSDNSHFAYNFQEIYNITEEAYGIDQQLINGNLYQYMYEHARGNPYLMDDNFSMGSLIFREREYNEISIIYDVYGGNLIIRSPEEMLQLSIILPIEFVSSFTISGMYFKKLLFSNDPPSYYQVIAEEDDISCFYHWSKSREVSDHNVSFRSYKFSESKNTKYLSLNDAFHQYRSNRSFRKRFPKEIQPEISAYLKSIKLKVSSATDFEMKELISHCQDLLTNYPL